MQPAASASDLLMAPLRHTLTSLALVAALLLASQAHAGRSVHLLTGQSQIVPEGDVELEQWIWGEGRVPARPLRPVLQWVWWAPVVGVSPHLELAFPLQLVSASDEVSLESVGIDLRYRLRPRLEDDGFQPLIRLAYAHPLSNYGGAARMTLNLVAEYGRADRAQVTLNLGGDWAVPFMTGGSHDADFALTASAGAAYPLPQDFRIGVEVATRAPLVTPRPASTVLYAGASVSWTHGPFWITAGSLFGLTDDSPRVFPKVLWAIEF